MELTITGMNKGQYGEWSKLPPNTKQAVAKEVSQLRLVNTETGEDLSGKYEVVPKGKKATPQQHEYRKREDDLGEYSREQGGFVFTFYKLADYVGNELKQADLARLLYMATYLSFGNNRLVYDNDLPIKKDGLKKLLGLKDRAFATFYKTVTELGVVKDYGSEIIMNSDYFYRGYLPKQYKGGELAYTRTYVKGIRALYADYGTTRKAGQLGLLYLVIPYVHFDTNILAGNPTETIHEFIEPLSLLEVANILGYTPDKITSALTGIVLGEEPVFVISQVGKEKYTYINSRVQWKGDKSPVNLNVLDIMTQIWKRKKREGKVTE